MPSKIFSRRRLLVSSTVLAGTGLFARSAAGAGTASLQTALQTAAAQFQPTIGALARTGVTELAKTTSLLSKLGLSPALLSALTNLQPGIQAGGGIKHKGLVRRVRNPAVMKTANNPHFVPQGQAFSASELRSYVSHPASGSGL